MSEGNVAPVETVRQTPEVTAQPGAGTMLRASREAQGLHIAMLAVSLKVPVAKLEALESDRYDLLPDIVFVRALASSVCRVLKIDAAPILAALPLSQMPKIKTDESGLNAAFNDSASRAGRAWLAQLSKPLVIAVLILLVGILAIVFLPAKTPNDSRSELLTGDKPQVTLGTPTAAEVNAQPAVNPLLPASAAPLTLSSSLSVDLQATTPGQAQTPGLNATVATVEPVGNSGDLLTLQALGASWIEVVDAKGISQSRKTLTKDEVISVSGALPLTVVLGRADLVSVKVRGQPFDAVSIAKDNVARFEVK
jgi:cytoskeleton protein RodZ